MKTSTFLIILLSICLISWKETNDTDWPEYLGGTDRNHYSYLTQFNANNANQLKLAWTYALPDSGQMQANPIVIQGI
jgi:quinoprotein glucose dehydrogenase